MNARNNDYTPRYRTPEGVFFNPLEPDAGVVDINHIATGLSNTCRYGGVLPGGIWYSNASHSLLVMQVAELLFENLKKKGNVVSGPSTCIAKALFSLAALLHDAPEVYLCLDIPSPIKALVEINGRRPEELEAEWMEEIFQGLTIAGSDDCFLALWSGEEGEMECLGGSALQYLVALADGIAKGIEEFILWGVPPLETELAYVDSGIRPNPVGPEVSRSHFLQHYHRLRAELEGT